VTCEETRIILHALIDNELDAGQTADVEAHVGCCPHCTARMCHYRGMREALSASSMRYQVPESLRGRIERALPTTASSAPRARATSRRRLLKGYSIGGLVSTALTGAVAAGAPYWRTLFNGFAFGSALSAAATALFMIAVVRSDQDQVIVSDVVSAHLRSLQANHLTDVQSSDQRGVEPWLNDRLGIAPPVPDLTAQGFKLIGGRIDYVLGKPVAAIVYRRSDHLINVFVAQGAQAERGARVGTMQGVNAVLWSEKGLNLCAVGDLSAEELAEFRKQFEAAAWTGQI
jgi:anti-sigma factor RsiW